MNRSNSSRGAATCQSPTVDYSRRNYGHNGYVSRNTNNYNNARGGPRRDHCIQSQGKRAMRGTFEVISISDNGQQLVVLETGWRLDINNLTHGLAHYAEFAEHGIDNMEPDCIYTCKDGDTWRRCRMMARHEPGNFLVELIDQGGSMTVARDKLLRLSQVFKEWKIRSMDAFFTGYAIESGSRDETQELRKILLNKTFQLAYTQEQTSPQQRARIFITEIKQQGEDILDVLLEKGWLKKLAQEQQHQPRQSQQQQRVWQQQQQNQRPFIQQVNYTGSPQHEKAPRRPRTPITRSRWGPQGLDPRSHLPYSGGTHPTQQEAQYGDSVHQPLGQQLAPAHENVCGTPEVRSAVSGTGHWTVQRAGGVGQDGDYPNSQRKEAPTTYTSAYANELQDSFQNLNINGGGNPTGQYDRSVQLPHQVTILWPCLSIEPIQKLICARLTNISLELRLVKSNIAQLQQLDPVMHGDIAREALGGWRRLGRMRVKEVERLLLTAPAETLASLGMSGWSQFVGVLWKPMMDRQYLDEWPLCLYKGTTIRQVKLEDDAVSKVVANPSQQSPQHQPERATILLERAIGIPGMFPILQSITVNRPQSRIHSVFFSEDNSKVFIQLECPQSTEQDAEEYAVNTIDLLNELRVIGS